MLNTIGDILPGTVVAIVVTIGTGYFVARQFAYTAVDRSQVHAGAATGDQRWRRVRAITDRTSFTLSGARFGITLASLALGSVSEPAVHHTLEPLRAGALPSAVATTGSFTLALLFISFLRLVVGEMAPKPWALSDAERAVIVAALPMRMFMVVFRPLSVVFTGAADRCLRLVGNDSLEALSFGRGPEAVRAVV